MLVLRELDSGREVEVADVRAYAFAPAGARVAYTVASADNARDGVYVRDLAQAGEPERTIHAAASKERGVGRVHNRVGRKCRDIRPERAQPHRHDDPLSTAGPCHSLFRRAAAIAAIDAPAATPHTSSPTVSMTRKP